MTIKNYEWDRKTEILSISKDLGEIGLDSLLKDGLFKDIPFFGTGLSVMKLLKSVSDRILLTKIIHFINELNLKNQDEINNFKNKYFKDEDYTKIGSKISLIIECSDNLIKIQWLAKSLRLFVNKELTKDDFQRVSSIINSAYVEDVRKISVFNLKTEISSHNELIETSILDHLFSIGLLESHGFDGENRLKTIGGAIYALNSFGKIFNEKII